jgi:diguanylate cyclase (GGDEF)-like protein
MKKGWGRAVPWGDARKGSVRTPAAEKVTGGRELEQLQVALQLIPVSQLANLTSVAALFWQWRRSGAPLLAGLLLLVSALLCVGFWLESRHLLRVGWASNERGRMARRVSVWGVALGLGCGLAGLLLFPQADPDGRFLLGVVAIGAMAAGALSLAVVPYASASWLLPYATCSALSLWQVSGTVYRISSVLLLMFVGVVLASVRATAQLFDNLGRARAQIELERGSVGMLLSDFERQASDWMWETDRAGRCTRVPERLARWLGQPGALLQERPLIDLLQVGLAPADEALQLLAEAAAQRWRAALCEPQPFRGIELPLLTPEGLTWWQLGGTPLFDQEGLHSGWRGVAQDITVQRQQAADLHRQASTDALTGLANRHAFQLRLQGLFQGPGSSLQLFILDLDDFKVVNDTHGHGVGDEVLREVGRRLARQVGSGEMLARLGGDEFAVILPAAPAAPAAPGLPEGVNLEGRLSERLEKLLAALRQPCDVEGHRIELRGSIGVAAVPQDAQDLPGLMRAADLALHAVKRSGGDGWRVHDAGLAARHVQQRALRADLALALGRDEFQLVYQPQVCLGDGRVAAFEALLRWVHPQRGPVAPGDFIELAEHSGLIVPLGAWVLMQACRDAMHWLPPPSAAVSAPVVAVNVSAVQMASRDLLSTVEQALRLSGLPPQRLELEVTESAVLRDLPVVRDNLAGLRCLGVRVALDDFGTGHSSLVHLRGLAPDALKIDQSFVQALPTDPVCAEIVRSLLDLARTLGMVSVAEGVETEAQLDRLMALRCDRVQGHHCGRALPAAAVPDYLARTWGEDCSAAVQTGGPIGGGVPKGETVPACQQQARWLS